MSVVPVLEDLWQPFPYHAEDPLSTPSAPVQTTSHSEIFNSWPFNGQDAEEELIGTYCFANQDFFENYLYSSCTKLNRSESPNLFPVSALMTQKNSSLPIPPPGECHHSTGESQIISSNARCKNTFIDDGFVVEQTVPTHCGPNTNSNSSHSTVCIGTSSLPDDDSLKIIHPQALIPSSNDTNNELSSVKQSKTYSNLSETRERNLNCLKDLASVTHQVSGTRSTDAGKTSLISKENLDTPFESGNLRTFSEKALVTNSRHDKLAERRRRNRESSSRCYYNRKRIKEQLDAQINAEKRHLMQLYDKALELRHENARLKRAVVTSGTSLPTTKRLRCFRRS